MVASAVLNGCVWVISRFAVLFMSVCVLGGLRGGFLDCVLDYVAVACVVVAVLVCARVVFLGCLVCFVVTVYGFSRSFVFRRGVVSQFFYSGSLVGCCPSVVCGSWASGGDGFSFGCFYGSTFLSVASVSHLVAAERGIVFK